MINSLKNAKNRGKNIVKDLGTNIYIFCFFCYHSKSIIKIIKSI